MRFVRPDGADLTSQLMSVFVTRAPGWVPFFVVWAVTVLSLIATKELVASFRLVNSYIV